MIAPHAALAVLRARSARCDVRREPPSSSDPTKRSCSRESALYSYAFRRLLLQIGGANIATDRALEAAYFVVARERKNMSPRSFSVRRRAIRVDGSLCLRVLCHPSKRRQTWHMLRSEAPASRLERRQTWAIQPWTHRRRLETRNAGRAQIVESAKLTAVSKPEETAGAPRFSKLISAPTSGA